jgi:carboxypeptidase C (cathepsin A)
LPRFLVTGVGGVARGGAALFASARHLFDPPRPRREATIPAFVNLIRLLLIAVAPFAFATATSSTFAQDVRLDTTAQVSPTVQRPGDLQSREHTLALPGRSLRYTATMGTLPLVDDKGAATAHVFFTSYTASGGAGGRPVLFVFNGGPGASSAFLHLGGVGPRIVPFDAQGAVAREPVQTADNPETWLTFADLVFVDPVGTGFSRVAGSEDAAARFFGIDKDADAMAAFVRTFLARFGRTTHPVFVAGASYGAFRSTLVAQRLAKSGFDLRGAVLIAPALDFSVIWGPSITLLPVALALPSIACSELERRLGVEADISACEDTEAFARGPYLLHLASGARDNDAISAEVARLTGLPLAEVARRFGRVTSGDYARAFQQANDRALSLYDGSFSRAVPKATDGRPADPLLDHTVVVLGPAFVAYAREHVGYTSDLPFHLLNREVRGKWDFGTSPQRQGFASALDELQELRTQKPKFRVLVASGLTDLVTPFAAARFMVDQLRPIAGAVPVDVKTYRGGHMMYLRAPTRQRLAADVRALVSSALDEVAP